MTEPAIHTLSNRLNTPTGNLVLLSLVTNGIYSLMWLYKHQDTIMQETGQRFASRLLIIWMAVCVGVSTALRLFFPLQLDRYGDSVNATADMMQGLATLISFAWCVLAVIWAFRARAALCQYALTTFRFDLQLNIFYTALFNIFYIMYCINDLPQALMKHQIINGKSQPQAHQKTSSAEE